MLKEGAEGIEKLKEKAHGLGLVLSDETIIKSHDLEKATDSLKASWKSFTMTLVQDSIPALTTIVNRLGEVATIAHLKGVVEENNKIIASYIYLRDDVIAYHDALESNLEIAERDVKSTYTTQKVKQDAAKKIIELTKSLQYVESEYNSKKKIQDDKDAEIARKKAADNSASEALKIEEERLQSLRDARDKAQKEYDDAIKITTQLQSSGLKDTATATKEVIDATKKYAEALVPIVEASGSNKIGAIALQNAKNMLSDLTAAELKAADDKKSYDDAILARQKSYSDAIKAQISDEEKYRSEQTEKYNKEVAKRDDVLKESSDAFDKLKSGEFKTFEDIERAKTEAEKSGCISQEEIEKASTKAKIALYTQYASQVLSTVSSLVSSLKSLYSADAQNKKDAIANELAAAEDAIDKELEAKLEAADVAEDTALEAAEKELKIAQDTVDGLEQINDAKKTLLDEEEEAKLYSLGLVEASTLEEYDKEIAAAIATGDTTTAATLQAARDKLAIEKEYDAKKQAIDDAQTLKDAQDAVTKAALEQEAADKKKALENQAALDTYDVEVAQFKTNQKLSYIQAVVDTASAVMQSAKSLPWPWNLIPMAASAAIGAVQMATIAKQTPPAPPILAAEGGIFPATSGGTNVQLAEAGETEVVFPLSKLESFLSSYTGSTANTDTTPIQLSIQMDSKVLYSGIFSATRDKTVLISTKALV
jgi:riboflavin synthase